MRNRVKVIAKYLKKQDFWGRIKINHNKDEKIVSYITKRFTINEFYNKYWSWNFITDKGVCLIDGLTDEEVAYLIKLV